MVNHLNYILEMGSDFTTLTESEMMGLLLSINPLEINKV
jgi:hypothetical protein